MHHDLKPLFGLNLNEKNQVYHFIKCCKSLFLCYLSGFPLSHACISVRRHTFVAAYSRAEGMYIWGLGRPTCLVARADVLIYLYCANTNRNITSWPTLYQLHMHLKGWRTDYWSRGGFVEVHRLHWSNMYVVFPIATCLWWVDVWRIKPEFINLTHHDTNMSMMYDVSIVAHSYGYHQDVMCGGCLLCLCCRRTLLNFVELLWGMGLMVRHMCWPP